MSTHIRGGFEVKDFLTLDVEAQRAIYQQANEDGDIEAVRGLNELGMKPPIPSFSGPSIISSFMDIASKYDAIFSFFKNLRETNRLLTEREALSLSTKEWIKKGSLSRIMGRDHLVQKIAEKNLACIKVPEKIVVITETKELIIEGWQEKARGMDSFYTLYSDQVTTYAKKIESVERKLSRKEIDELIQIIAAANFSDLNRDNIVVAQDGIYLIDTEFKSFADRISWEKMGRFNGLIDQEDLAYFQNSVQEKAKEPLTIGEPTYYHSLTFYLTAMQEAGQTPPETIKTAVTALEYVGMKKAGNGCFSQNTFSLNLNDIL
jgi:hypothetical protein